MKPIGFFSFDNRQEEIGITPAFKNSLTKETKKEKLEESPNPKTESHRKSIVVKSKLETNNGNKINSTNQRVQSRTGTSDNTQSMFNNTFTSNFNMDMRLPSNKLSNIYTL